MTAVPFDTLKLAERLQAGGFTPEQAKTAATALAEALGESVATKADLRDLEQRLTIKIAALIVVLGGFLAAITFFD